MIKTFEDAVKFLEKYVPIPGKKYPGNLGLERMMEFCNLLNNPQLKYPTIHVGGTSGKGSTSTILASILATKYKIGLHTSPHLVRINERIKISSNNIKQITNNRKTLKDISNQDFISLVNEVRPVVEKMEKGKWGPPSYFEIVTAMAFLYFQRQKVDIAVIEVGLGGKFDATNVIKPLVAVLTNVGLDHTDVLGNTVEKIAEDKVGIIKPEIQVVSGVRQSSVINILKSNCKDKRSKLSLLGKDFSYQLKSVTEKGSVFDYFGEKTINNLKINMLGEFQVENAVLAIRTVEKLSANKTSLRGTEAAVTKQSTDPAGLPRSFHSLAMTEVDIRKGLLNAFIPGRLEIINRNPLVILDGAHNPDKMKALVQSIKTIFPGKKVRAIVAIKEDKNAAEILRIILPICQKIIFTYYEIKADQGIIRSYDPVKLLHLAKLINPKKKYSVNEKPLEEINQFNKKASKKDLLLITGSLYLVGEIKNQTLKNPDITPLCICILSSRALRRGDPVGSGDCRVATDTAPRNDTSNLKLNWGNVSKESY